MRILSHFSGKARAFLSVCALVCLLACACSEEEPPVLIEPPEQGINGIWRINKLDTYGANLYSSKSAMQEAEQAISGFMGLVRIQSHGKSIEIKNNYEDLVFLPDKVDYDGHKYVCYHGSRQALIIEQPQLDRIIISYRGAALVLDRTPPGQPDQELLRKSGYWLVSSSQDQGVAKGGYALLDAETQRMVFFDRNLGQVSENFLTPYKDVIGEPAGVATFFGQGFYFSTHISDRKIEFEGPGGTVKMKRAEVEPDFRRLNGLWQLDGDQGKKLALGAGLRDEISGGFLYLFSELPDVCGMGVLRPAKTDFLPLRISAMAMEKAGEASFIVQRGKRPALTLTMLGEDQMQIKMVRKKLKETETLDDCTEISVFKRVKTW